MDPDRGELAPSGRSAELRGLLAEVQREHGVNRALMRQELAFLVHLTRQIGVDGRGRRLPAAQRAGRHMRATRDPPPRPSASAAPWT